MKIKLNENAIVNINMCMNKIGCHSIDCFQLTKLKCEECNIYKENLAGTFFTESDIKDILIKGD